MKINIVFFPNYNKENNNCSQLEAFSFSNPDKYYLIWDTGKNFSFVLSLE